MGTEITPNEEVDEYGWYSPKDALELPLLDSTRELIEQYVEYLKSNTNS